MVNLFSTYTAGTGGDNPTEETVITDFLGGGILPKVSITPFAGHFGLCIGDNPILVPQNVNVNAKIMGQFVQPGMGWPTRRGGQHTNFSP